MKKIVLLFAMVVLMVGCAVPPVVKVPSDEQVKSADYGEKPDMAQVEKNIKEWSIQALKDPSSMQILDISSSSKEGWLFQPCLGHILPSRMNSLTK